MNLLYFTFLFRFGNFDFTRMLKNFCFFQLKNIINFQQGKNKKLYRHYFNIYKGTLQDKQIEVATHKSSLQTSFQLYQNRR